MLKLHNALDKRCFLVLLTETKGTNNPMQTKTHINEKPPNLDG